MKPFIVIGGAGYVGLALVKALLDAGCEKVHVVSRNAQKAVLFRDARVNVVTSLTEINEEGVLVNLAFANSSDYSNIRNATTALMNDIQDFEQRNGFSFLVHVSTVVLSEQGLKFGEVNKREGYIYSKSLQEHQLLKKFDAAKVSIVRAGNILSPNSPWMHKIASKIIADAPLCFKGKNGSSNATNLQFLVRTIIEVGANQHQGNFNCCELSTYRWDKFIGLAAEAMGKNKIAEFDDSIAKPVSLLTLFKYSLRGFALSLNSSPWHSDALNRVVCSKWIPVSKGRIRRDAKFKRPTTFKVDVRTAKDFKLFCRSKEVPSSFLLDYDVEAFCRSLTTGLDEMGF